MNVTGNLYHLCVSFDFDLSHVTRKQKTHSECIIPLIKLVVTLMKVKIKNEPRELIRNSFTNPTKIFEYFFFINSLK